MLPKNEISALISLLDDPDDFVFNEVKSKLLSYGSDVIPFLENFWESNPLDIQSQSRIENIIQQIQQDAIVVGLKEWKSESEPDLLEGMLLLNKFQYPDLDVQPIRDKIDQIKRDIWIELNNNLTSFEKINIINQVLFDIYGFSGNKQNYHSPNNSYLSDVFETKKGNPLSLSVIYLLVTQQLGLPVYGVNLPSHFILCYLDELNINFEATPEEQESEVLMYINPFSRGTIFNKKEIERFLAQLKIEVKPSYFEPCTTIEIIKRVINNLMFSYEKQGYKHKVEDLKALQAVLD